MTKKTAPEDLLIGAHTSAAGGVQNALYEGQKIGATTIQLFTRNQKQWNAKPLADEEIELWNKAEKETGLKQIMSHDSYLINLGSPNADALQKSRHAFREESLRCTKLGISYLNFHPGAALDGDPQQCLETICESLIQLHDVFKGQKTRVLLETTAGQGSSVGHSFEQLAFIIKNVKQKIPIGVCIDTCHIFAAGYDIRTKQALEHTLKEFDAVIGLDHLYTFHLNDSVKPLGSRVDRHAALGEGLIGIECFRLLMQDPRTRELPKYLETPEGPPLWEKEIRMLREFAA